MIETNHTIASLNYQEQNSPCEKFSLETLDCIPGTVAFDAVVDYLEEHGEWRPSPAADPEPMTRAKSLKGALVFGAILRFARMEMGRCCATAATIAKNARCVARTFSQYRDVLIEAGLIVDHTPGLRNKPHHLTITDLAYSLIFPSLESDSHPSLESDSHPSLESDSNDSDDEDERYLFIDRLESFSLYQQDFGKPTRAQLAQLQKWLDDPKIPDEWINHALGVTIARQPDSPWSYLAAVVRDYAANGGPPETRLATAAAGESVAAADSEVQPDYPSSQEIGVEILVQGGRPGDHGHRVIQLCRRFWPEYSLAEIVRMAMGLESTPGQASTPAPPGTVKESNPEPAHVDGVLPESQLGAYL